MRRRAASDDVAEAIPGFKIAYPMVSADGRSVGFNGVALGRTQVYGVVADAVCVQCVRHRCPSAWCDCGFYCFHDAAEARALACDSEYPGAVLLEVLASGRYISYELGLRYARQTVQAMRVGRCSCGRGAAAFAQGGEGVVGWRRLGAICALCAGTRPVISLDTFARLADPLGTLTVTPDAGVDDSAFAPLDHGLDGSRQLEDAASVPLLSAEVALLQARLDELQRHLDHLTRPER